MDVTIRKPDRRTCERCGRTEVYDEDEGSWQLAGDDDPEEVGDVYCIHEWDINGTFLPFEEPV